MCEATEEVQKNKCQLSQFSQLAQIKAHLYGQWSHSCAAWLMEPPP